MRGSTLLLHSLRPVSRPIRRALPLPLPDAPSLRRPESRFQPLAAPLCLLGAGTLSVHRGFHLYYITSARALCQAVILFFVNKEKKQKKNFLRETAVSLMFEFVQIDVVQTHTTFPPLHTYV